jgi:hypothetical protein
MGEHALSSMVLFAIVAVVRLLFNGTIHNSSSQPSVLASVVEVKIVEVIEASNGIWVAV